MQLKSKAEVETAINQLFKSTGFAAVAGVDSTTEVMSMCAPHAASVAAYHEAMAAGGVSAIQFLPIIMLALQILPIIFGPDGFTPEKFQQIIQLILSVFQTT